MQRLEQKVIVIIGGTSGIGLAAAKACIANGARVVAVGRADEHLPIAQETLHTNALVLAAEATNPATAREAIKQARARFGDFHGLYHVAGGSGRKFGDGPLHEVTDEGLEATLRLNFNSVVYSNRAAVQAFLEQKNGGSILNVSSVLAFSPSPKHFATHIYSAAKAAIIGLSQAIAAYYAPHNIRINVLAPALTQTPMAQRAVHDESIVRYAKTKQPLDGGRMAVPEDLEEAAVFFMSEGARFITGQVLAIDGGWMMSEGC